MLQPKSATEIG